jgi:hypothetical protein
MRVDVFAEEDDLGGDVAPVGLRAMFRNAWKMAQYRGLRE